MNWSVPSEPNSSITIIIIFFILIVSKWCHFGGYKNTFNPPSPSVSKVKKLSPPMHYNTNTSSHQRSPQPLHNLPRCKTYCNHPPSSSPHYNPPLSSSPCYKNPSQCSKPSTPPNSLQPPPLSQSPLAIKASLRKTHLCALWAFIILMYFIIIIMILCLIFHFYKFFFLFIY